MSGDQADRSGAANPTFMLTDIKGSTSLYERFPDQMFEFMGTHDTIVLGAIEGAGGEQFKHTGDGAWAVFEEPIGAIEAAVQIQRDAASLHVGDSEPVVIRIGISTGQARRRKGDFFGPALNVTARLEGAASGRQILISESTRAMIGSETPDWLEFQDLGQHRFKGVEPLRVFQVKAPGLPSDFPEIGGKREAPVGNLPADLSSFLGRKRELAEVIDLVESNRITTLLGPGGIGKTRLSIKAAQETTTTFDDGKFLIDLSPVEPGQDVWPAFTAALLIPPVADATPRVQVLDRLKNSNALLIVDNCEHVHSDIIEAITEIATNSPVRILATSRHVLGVPGEALFDMIPLEGSDGVDPSASPAVQLFVDRGRLINRRFDPTPEDLAKVAVICEALARLGPPSVAYYRHDGGAVAAPINRRHS
jgi:class 3 adenylate cyclase